MLLIRKLFSRLVFGAFFGDARKRTKIAHRWLAGCGIEIGALHNPLPTNPGTDVIYVDRMDNSELLYHYPEISEKRLVPVDIIDDGESLSSIKDMSQDFVIANHMFEHCLNPIGALEAWLRVLKVGGIAYIAVPDKRFTFDYKRTTTTWKHLLHDFSETAESSHEVHYLDWINNVMKIPECEVEGTLAQLLQMQYRIHFHTWTASTLNEFFEKCQIHLAFPITLCDFVRNGHELIAVLKKVRIQATGAEIT